MLPDLPIFKDDTPHVTTGKYMQRLIDRIRLQTPLGSAFVQVQETDAGIALHAAPPGVAPPPFTLSHDFKATLAGTNTLAIQAGRVNAINWGTPNADDPLPSQWLQEYAVAGSAGLSVPSGGTVWLKIECTRTDVPMDGALSATDAIARSVSGGAGGGGGGGGGGGAGGGGLIGYAGLTGGDASGTTPGISGEGGLGGFDSGGEDPGTPAEGAAGGNGGAGGSGQAKSFANYEKILIVWRRWQVTSASLVVNPTTPSTPTSILVRIASQTDGVITQYQAGSFQLTLPTTTFISAFVP
jgi:hypothetical protein